MRHPSPFIRRTCRHALLACVAMWILEAPILADVQLARLFTDHGVLQQQRHLPVWGTADPGEAVTVEFGGKKATAVADEKGRWTAWLPPFLASAEGREMKVTGKNTVTVKDLLVGEVWLGSGQSNMQWAMRQTHEPDTAIANSANPQLRLFTVERRRSRTPLDTFQNAENHKWTLSGPDAVRDFSAVAYYFGRDLQAALGVPVGIIHSSWGGSPVEVWIKRDLLEADAEWRKDILETGEAQWKAHEAAVTKWEASKAAAEAANEKFSQGRPGQPWYPAELYNAMIHPVLPYAMAGFIWYQGESNASRAWQYRRLYADMIRNWRSDWGQGPLPFLAVQLAPWDKNRKRSIEEITAKPVESDWAELREAQNLSAAILPQVGVAVITDVGDKDDIHPVLKEPVGGRLALLARTIAYGEDVQSTGPVWNGMRRARDTVILNFEGVGDGLRTSNGAAPTGFAVAGEDRVFHWAKAEIRRVREVHLTCEAVAEPVAVRYGWADYPVINLINSSSLPASPFRTDGWPATTAK
jgi:sialate O-acetylesterase